jgi:hypothetical protein
MPVEKVLIVVKTYPAISGKYDELVCTAGFREDGTWIRIYPVQFRQKAYSEQYKKWQWIELDLVKNTGDSRPESYRPYSRNTPIKIVGDIKADGNTWAERRKFALRKIYTNKAALIAEAKDRDLITSLATFKPKEIVDFKIEAVNREWDSKKLESLKQMQLFDTKKNDRPLEVVRKLPYKFSYTFLDEQDVPSTLMIEDWELGQLYWRCLQRHGGDETKACADVRKKYFDDFANTKDLYLFLGTTKLNHYVALNPFVIIGTFHPKPETQHSMF